MTRAAVTVLILAPQPDPDAGPLLRVLEAARIVLAERHRRAFLEARATTAEIVREPADVTPFGARLRRLLEARRPAGLVILGAGSMALANDADIGAFVETAGGDAPGALANNAYSADAIAIACAGDALRGLPADLSGDNALPRWLAEVAGVPVHDLRARRDLAVDVDSPLDLVLLEDALRAGFAAEDDPLPLPDDADATAVRERLGALRVLARDPAAELLVAGRIASADLHRIDVGTRSRTRAVVEERGLRTASLAAARGRPNRRPPRSLLGELLAHDGPAGLAGIVERHADGALVDTRVLLAARLGADASAWPHAEDRFASDLLLADRVRDPWLRVLTASAADARVPILLGGHTLVGPGAALALGIGFDGGGGDGSTGGAR